MQVQALLDRAQREVFRLWDMQKAIEHLEVELGIELSAEQRTRVLARCRRWVRNEEVR